VVGKGGLGVAERIEKTTFIGEKQIGEGTLDWKRTELLQLRDGFNHIFIEGDEISLFFPINRDISQRDEEHGFVVKQIGDSIAHGGNKQIPCVRAQRRPHSDFRSFSQMHPPPPGYI
jgi:hypothetical protein